MAAQPPSFITEAPHAHHADYEAELAKQLAADYEQTMKDPRENCRKLMDVAGQLNEKMKALLEKERHEFVAAYRAHTKKIQEDLARLRARVAEEQESLHRDEKVKRLSRERDDYRAQALALDAGNANLSASLEATRAKLEVLEDDRNFVVRALRKAAAASRKLAPSEKPANGRDGNEGGLYALSVEDGSVESMDTSELLQNLQAATEDKEPLFLPSIGNRSSGERSPRVASTNPNGGDEEVDEAAIVEALRNELKHLKKSGRNEQKALEKATREVQALQKRRENNWLEALLVACVKDAGDKVLRRRAEAETRAAGSAGASKSALMLAMQANAAAAGGGGGSPGGDNASESGADGLALDAWGEAPLRLETLTAADRTSALRTFLADPRVVTALNRKQADLAATARQENGDHSPGAWGLTRRQKQLLMGDTNEGVSPTRSDDFPATPMDDPPPVAVATLSSLPRAPPVMSSSASKQGKASSLASMPPKVSRLGPLGGQR